MGKAPLPLFAISKRWPAPREQRTEGGEERHRSGLSARETIPLPPVPISSISFQPSSSRPADTMAFGGVFCVSSSCTLSSVQKRARFMVRLRAGKREQRPDIVPVSCLQRSDVPGT